MNQKQYSNTPTSQQPQRISCLLIGGMGVFVILVVIFILLRLAGALLVVADSIHPSDAAVVLSGGDNTRIDEAVLLYQEKYMEYIILTETELPQPEKSGEHTTLMRYITIEKGIPGRQVIITKQQAQSTYEEAKAVLKLVKQRGFDSLIVITDPYHTFRTRLIFRDVFRDEGIRVAVHPVRDHWYSSSTWWLHKDGWQITIQEYIKLAAYLAGRK